MKIFLAGHSGMVGSSILQKLKRKYKLDAPKGVNGRNSDNTLILNKFNWEPSISIETGLEKTYKWIYDQMNKYP